MENVLGLIGIVIFCACVIVLAAAVTWLVVRLSPSKSSKPPQPTATPDS
jgi:FlaG/FlaF family flagellin (archaellin)